MVPRITSKGRSFEGAGAYFLHDLGSSDTAERVGFTHTVNMLTDDAEKALRVMAWTAMHGDDLKQLAGKKLTGRKAQNPVYNFTLAWAPDEKPNRDQMIELGERALRTLGVEEHEALMVAHTDTDHPHLHIILNRVHPVTGIMATMSKDRIALSKLAEAYEKENGKIYCEVRVANNRARRDGSWVKHSEDRQMHTKDYQARRKKRMEAQRMVAEREKAVKRAARASDGGRSPRTEPSEHQADARQPSVEKLVTPFRDAALVQKEPVEAPKREPADSNATKTQARPAGKRSRAFEAKRRAWIDDKRAEEWTGYEERQWGEFHARQTEQRETLHARQAGQRTEFERRLDARYREQTEHYETRMRDLTCELERKDVKGLLSRITGKAKRNEQALAATQRGYDRMLKQKQGEWQPFEQQQAKARAVQSERFEATRLRKIDELARTRAKQDKGFEEREQARAAGLKAKRSRAPKQKLQDVQVERQSKRKQDGLSPEFTGQSRRKSRDEFNPRTAMTNSTAAKPQSSIAPAIAGKPETQATLRQQAFTDATKPTANTADAARSQNERADPLVTSPTDDGDIANQKDRDRGLER